VANQRDHRWSDRYQFWFGVISILFVIIGGIWHMSSRLATMEQHILTQSQRAETGFKHVSRALDNLNREKSSFQAKIEQVYLRCCSELNASSK